MSAATVRAAIQTYLAGGNIVGLQKVYKAPPWWIDGGTFKLSTVGPGGQPLGWGAVACINLDEQTETRIDLPAPNTLGGPVGNKAVHYSVGVLIIAKYLIPTDGTSEDSWVDSIDTLTEGLVARIRADPNLGAPSIVFQAGQDQQDLKISRDLPKKDPKGGAIHIWQLLQFQLTEIVTA